MATRSLLSIISQLQSPLVLIGSRVAFAVLFVFIVYATATNLFPGSQIDFIWIVYLVALYALAEYVHGMFRTRGVDLAFSFPLLFAVYILNMVSMILDAQTHLPLLNRAEHFASFVLISYVIWVFFLQYLPQKVWRDHPYYTALLVFSVSSAVGSANEIIELAMDVQFQNRVIGDRYDTSLDILMNSLGTGLFLAARLIIGTTEERSS